MSAVRDDTAARKKQDGARHGASKHMSGDKPNGTAGPGQTLSGEQKDEGAQMESTDDSSGRYPLVEKREGDTATRHVPVLLKEVLSFQNPRSGQRYLDATLGLGGHASALLRNAATSGVTDVQLLGLDRDASALALARVRLAPFGQAVHTRHRPFSDCEAAFVDMRSHGWTGIDFVLADIGVSSLQLDEAERGFSFWANGPLDMRMDQSRGKNAATLVNETPVARLMEIIRTYGEDPMAGRIARAIDDARAEKRIESTLELARIVERAYPAKWRATSRNHPATRTFQALRMAVNDELGELECFLRSAVTLLNPKGRVAVITFHSLEDRIVKRFFRTEAASCLCPSHVPVCVCGHKASLRILTPKPLGPSREEVAANPRAASAKLRVAERVEYE
jgi:16S rRNA (cytosine1402-N4)-methyltransferase